MKKEQEMKFSDRERSGKGEGKDATRPNLRPSDQASSVRNELPRSLTQVLPSRGYLRVETEGSLDLDVGGGRVRDGSSGRLLGDDDGSFEETDGSKDVVESCIVRGSEGVDVLSNVAAVERKEGEE